MIFFLLACTPGDSAKDTGTPTDTSDTSDTDTDTVDTEDTAETGDTNDTSDTQDTTETGDTQDTGAPCGGAESCALTVTGATVDCGSTDSSDPASIEASQSGAGEVQVLAINVVEGCCPEGVSVVATLYPDTARILPEWGLGQDDCDCVCMLDVAFTLSDVPDGSWEIAAAGASTTVVVSP